MRKLVTCLMALALVVSASTVSFGSDGATTTEEPIYLDVITDDFNFGYTYAYTCERDFATHEVVFSFEIIKGVSLVIMDEVELSLVELEAMLDGFLTQPGDAKAPDPSDSETIDSRFSGVVSYLLFTFNYAKLITPFQRTHAYWPRE